jgi:hypothetical protein
VPGAGLLPAPGAGTEHPSPSSCNVRHTAVLACRGAQGSAEPARPVAVRVVPHDGDGIGRDDNFGPVGPSQMVLPQVRSRMADLCTRAPEDPAPSPLETRNQIAPHAVTKRGLGTGGWGLEAGDWRLGTGGWGSEAGDWRLGTGGWGSEVGDWGLEAGKQAFRRAGRLRSASTPGPCLPSPLPLALSP